MPRRMGRRMPMAYPVKIKNQVSFKESSLMGSKHIFDVVGVLQTGEQRTVSGQVTPGSHIYRINFSVNAIVASGAGSTDFDFYVCILRSGQTVGATFPTADWSDIGLSKVRNQIFYSDANQIGSEDAGPLRRKFSVKLPKIYQRMRDGDSIKLIYDNPGDNVQVSMNARFSSFS